MSDRPTPETDGQPRSIGIGCGGTYSMVDAEFARKLERERDEAREKYSTEATEYMLSVNKLCGERDDARNKLADALQEIDLRTLDFERMKQERDEAREALRTLAEHGEIEIQKLIKERDEARELVKAYQDYTQLLGDEISDMASVAYVHGWRSNRYEQGKVLREKIKQLEEAK